ncbi:MAG TPA: hypothetical protein VFD56_01115 [Chitinophagaceae bacterium]|nr:hypothetical protein [Chitinophagaceae bacterium]
MKSLIKSARLATAVVFPGFLIAVGLSASYIAKLRGAESKCGPNSSPKNCGHYFLSKPETS